MNVLAHALLAEQSGCSLIGSLLGDCVRGVPPAHYPQPWRHGIRLHRRIDSFVDHHAVSARSVQRLPPELRRWARVALDVYYDHLLACDWGRYSPIPLPQFTSTVYRALAEQQQALPPRLVRFAEFMSARDLLAAYRDPDVIAQVLTRLAGRCRRPSTLAQTFPFLVQAHAGLGEDLRQLYPCALAFARAEVAARQLCAAA